MSPPKEAAHGRIATCHAQLIDLATGKATFDWNALDHVAVQESYQIAPRKAKNLYDFFHMNSLQMLPDGNILISARNTWTVYKVNAKSGEIMWRMGGKKSDFHVDPQAQWAWQHHATMWTPTEMTLFDNSSTKGPLSRGLLLNVDESAMTVTLGQEFKNPTGFYSGTLGMKHNPDVLHALAESQQLLLVKVRALRELGGSRGVHDAPPQDDLRRGPGTAFSSHVEVDPATMGVPPQALTTPAEPEVAPEFDARGRDYNFFDELDAKLARMDGLGGEG